MMPLASVCPLAPRRFLSVLSPSHFLAAQKRFALFSVPSVARRVHSFLFLQLSAVDLFLPQLSHD